MTILLLIALAVGVGTRQKHKYYRRVLMAFGAWVALIILAAAIGDAVDNPTYGAFMFLLTAVSWAIPIVMIADAYERRELYSLVPRRRWHETKKDTTD